MCSICFLLTALFAAAAWLGGDRLVSALWESPLTQEAKSGDTVAVTGQVYKKEIKSDYQILYLKNNSIKFRKQKLKESKFIVYDKPIHKIKTGNWITAEGKVRLYEEPRNPGNFDEKQYYGRQGIRACMWSDITKVTKKDVWKVRDSLSTFRQEWKKILYDSMGEEQGAILCGIMLGDKADIDPAVKELYQLNGISHILAISGLHLSFVGAGLYSFVRRMSGSYVAGGLAGIFFLSLYILMIGMSISAMRAVVMYTIRVGADMTGRSYDAPTALGVAAVAVILWRPLSFYDGAFHLSFGAVAGIVFIYPLFETCVNDRRPFENAVVRWLIKAAGASVSIQLATFPVLLYHFYEFPLYSVLLNLVVIPLMRLLLFAGIVGSAAMCACPPAGLALLACCRWILVLYETLCTLAANLPASRIITGRPPLLWIVFYYVTLLAAVMTVRRGESVRRRDKGGKAAVRRCRWTAAICVLTGITCLVAFCPAGSKKGLEITVLDVGQGDSIFIRDESGFSCLVDGGSSDIKNVGRYRIESFLKSEGVDVLDYVFVSHGDSDHMNGIEELIERKDTGIKIKMLVLPARNVWDESLYRLAVQAEEAGIRVFVAEPGQIIKRKTSKMPKPLEIECIQPGEDYGGEKGNAASMVLAVRYGKFDMLFTGDVEEEGEEQLADYLRTVQENEKRTWEVLKAAHHGSENSTKEEMLVEMCPGYTVISAGVDNRYGHPHPATVKRLADAGSTVYSTQECGAVRIRVRDNKMWISPHLRRQHSD